MLKYIMLPAMLTVPAAALADPLVLKPVGEARLRYEGVSQDGIAEDADALTFRVRAGVEGKSGPFAVLVEGEATLAGIEHYNSGVNGLTAYPVVADPQNVELNRLQVQFSGLPKALVTVGRQRINLDDQRFVGSVGWRQNEQTFDAVRLEWTGIKGVRADLTYAWRQRTIWGVDGTGARPPAMPGDNVFATLGYKAERWGVTGFAYLVDQNSPAVQGFRLSSQTYGARANVTVPLGKAKLGLTASYARQSDWSANPNSYSADYWLGEATLEVSGFRLTGGYEVLGANSGVALTSFQTPLATLHKFNGTADKFLTTPPNGLCDLYFGLSRSFKVAALPGLNAGVTWHRYRSDRLGLTYGSEWDAQAGFKIGRKLALLGKFASYRRSGVADFAGDADTDKFWLQLEYAL
jgi:hypothetical protein